MGMYRAEESWEPRENGFQATRNSRHCFFITPMLTTHSIDSFLWACPKGSSRRELPFNQVLAIAVVAIKSGVSLLRQARSEDDGRRVYFFVPISLKREASEDEVNVPVWGHLCHLFVVPDVGMDDSGQ